MPHDYLAEKSLVGCLIIDGQAFDELADLSLGKEDFYNPGYGVMFDAVRDLAYSNKPIDYVTVSSKLTEMGKLEEVGGAGALLEVVEHQAHAANIYHYAKTVKEKSSLRNIVRTAQSVAKLGMGYTGEISEFITEVEGKFFNLTNDAKSGKLGEIKEYLKNNLRALEDTSRKAGEISGLATGYPDLDKKLLGLQSGQLIILAARPAMGKSALALNFALNTCISSGLPVVIFSLEMTANDLSMRMLSSRAKVDSRRIRTKDFLDTDLRALGGAVGDLSQLPIFINDGGGTSVLDIQSQCRKLKSEKGIGLIIIDYLQLLSPANRMAPREQQVSEMSRTLKEMAKELECPILALSQLNRAVESRPDKRPGPADLRESGSLEQDADIIMFIYRDEVYNPDSKDMGTAEIIIGKNRGGEIGMTRLGWVGAYTSFENLAPRETHHS